MTRPWVVVGCGGHGREVADVLRAWGRQVIGFLDDDPAREGARVGGLPVLGSLDWLLKAGEPLSVAVGIGSSLARRSVYERILLLNPAIDFPPIIHPSALLGSRIAIGEGALVQAGCTLTCDISIGRFVVLNIGVGISHDVRVADFATIGPRSQFTGATACGVCAEVGAGTIVIPGRSIGDGATTGAGAVIIRDVQPSSTVVGVPARPPRSAQAFAPLSRP